MMIRVGEGWDTHRLVTGRSLILGGVLIPYEKGLEGHSDADALLHAITDSILGAVGLGDIGRHFPDTDQLFQDADSAHLLQIAYEKAKAQGWILANLDSTIIAQAPKLVPYMIHIQKRIAEILNCSPNQVNIKAKTAEKMGPVGEGLSIEVRAVCLLTKC